MKATTTRDRILSAAAEVLSRRGYSETRLSDIAELAEVRAPAVYHYFPSRKALIAEVMSVGQQRLREHVEKALAELPQQADPMERICTAVAAHLQVALDLSEFATAVTRNLGQLPEDIRRLLRAETATYMDLWRTLLDDAQRAGAIRPELELRAARMLVIGGLNWAPEWWDPRQGALTTVITTAQSLVRTGLGTR